VSKNEETKEEKRAGARNTAEGERRYCRSARAFYFLPSDLRAASMACDLAAGLCSGCERKEATEASRLKKTDMRTEPARAGSVVFWGACCAAWPIVKAPPKNKKKKTDRYIRR
jgi:hypothetical protein